MTSNPIAGLRQVCIECGAIATQFGELATGRVRKDGHDWGQVWYLCDEHAPTETDWKQPKNCKSVTFYWSEAVAPNHDQQ